MKYLALDAPHALVALRKMLRCCMGYRIAQEKCFWIGVYMVGQDATYCCSTDTQ